MSSVAVSHPLMSREFRVNSYLLLSLYTIIPVAILTVLVDKLFLGNVLRDHYLPSNPATLLVWAIVFNFPHIVSSLVTLADDEYIPYYKKRFGKALMIIIAGVLLVNVLLPMVLEPKYATGLYGLFFIFFATYTMYHVLSQQFGIGMMLMKVRPTKHYESWRWLSTFATAAMYGMVFAKPNLQAAQFGAYTVYDMALVFALVFVVLATIVGLTLTFGSQRRLGTVYVTTNVIMLIATLSLLYLDYSFFVIAIPRFVHDITAFIIYSTHDQNRNREVQHNYIYRFLSFLSIPPIILCPLLAIVLANSVECGAYMLDVGLGFSHIASECVVSRFYHPVVENGLPLSMQVGLQIMFICGFFHYHIESFVWKREAIHRHSVAFS